MPARAFVARFILAPAVFLAAALAVLASSGAAQPPKIDSGKKSPDTSKATPAPTPKDQPKTPPPSAIRLPDGTYLWVTPTPGAPDRGPLTAAEVQKLADQVDQLKKQLVARKPVAPSACVIRGKIERRGETLVAALRITYSFRTTAPNTAVALGCKRAFLVAASLDGGKLPVFEPGEDGLVVLIESADDHTVVLDLEAAVTGRGGKTEIGFELGLPRAAITRLAIEPPADVKRVNLTTRTPDPTQPAKPPEVRRTPGLDAKQLSPHNGSEAGYPLGPVDLAELTWDPPAAASPTADAVQSAELDVACLLTESLVETTARIRLRGAALVWHIAAPAEPIPERSSPVAVAPVPGAEPAPVQQPTVTRPPDPKKPVWTVTFPPGASPADWVFVVTARQDRPKPGDPKHRGPFPVGPLAVLGVVQQTGKVRVTAGPHTRFGFKHGPDLRRDVPAGPADEEVSVATFRLATGPTGTVTPTDPLLRVEADPQVGVLRVKPTYRLRLTPAGWQVRAEVRVTPYRTETDSIAVEVPAEWRTPEASPADVVEGVQTMRMDGDRRLLAVRLLTPHKQPFDFVLETTVPVMPGAAEAAVPLPRFPGATEAEATITAVVPDGTEVRGSAREWDQDRPAGWSQPLAAPTGPDGRPARVATTITGRFEHGLAQADLTWQPFRPELVADIRAAAVVRDGPGGQGWEVNVVERLRLQSPSGLDRPVTLRGLLGGVQPEVLAGPFKLLEGEKGEWTAVPRPNTRPDLRDTTLILSYTIRLPEPRGDDPGPWAVPVGLLWPVEATRTNTVVRVWPGAGAFRATGADRRGWRGPPVGPPAEGDPVPPEAAGSPPVSTLSGNEPGLPLTLDVRPASASARDAVSVRRGLIVARPVDGGGTGFTAQFLLEAWAGGAIEIDLPGPLASRATEVLVDGKPVGFTLSEPDAAGGQTVRIVLPSGRSAGETRVGVRYQCQTALRPNGAGAYVPPRVRRAMYDGPVRWHITLPTGSVPLLVSRDRAEQSWRFGSGMLQPVAGRAEDALQHWLETGEDRDTAGDTDELVVVQASLEPVEVVRASRPGLLILASLVVFVTGLTLSRVRGAVAGPVVALIGGAVAVAAVRYPQPTAQVAGAAQPGLFALVAVLGVFAAARWYQRHRVTHLPGFTRARVDSTGPSSAGAGTPSSRPRQPGSTGASEVPAEPLPTPSGS